MATNTFDLQSIHLDTGAHSSADAGMCVMWEGRRDENGYGRVGRKRAHRLAWEEANGASIPPGLVVMHSCDNPPCVNPNHLNLGTVADNNRDRAAKGRSKGTFPSGDAHPARQRRGSCHWCARLTDDDVRGIRSRRAAGETQTAIAHEFNIHPATVSRIVRRIWRQEVI